MAHFPDTISIPTDTGTAPRTPEGQLVTGWPGDAGVRRGGTGRPSRPDAAHPGARARQRERPSALAATGPASPATPAPRQTVPAPSGEARPRARLQQPRQDTGDTSRQTQQQQRDQTGAPRPRYPHVTIITTSRQRPHTGRSARHPPAQIQRPTSLKVTLCRTGRSYEPAGAAVGWWCAGWWWWAGLVWIVAAASRGT